MSEPNIKSKKLSQYIFESMKDVRGYPDLDLVILADAEEKIQQLQEEVSEADDKIHDLEEQVESAKTIFANLVEWLDEQSYLMKSKELKNQVDRVFGKSFPAEVKG